MIEPTACAVHAARQVAQQADHQSAQVAIIGGGTLGLLTIAALHQLGDGCTIVATAKHPHQRTLAKELGSAVVCSPQELASRVRSMTHSLILDGRLTDGISEVVDCVGSEESLRQALSVVAPGGTVHVVGMPSTVTLDLTPLWHREVTLRGSYAYTRDDFSTAVELVRERKLGRLVSATYPLARYREAIEHAANAGSRGAVKIAFDLRAEKERNR